MTVTLQKIVEQVNTLSQEERAELGRFLAESRVGNRVRPGDQAQLLASIRRRRSFCPADNDLPDSLMVLREDRLLAGTPYSVQALRTFPIPRPE